MKSRIAPIASATAAIIPTTIPAITPPDREPDVDSEGILEGDNVEEVGALASLLVEEEVELDMESPLL